MRRPLWIPWRWWRRASQLGFLALFLWLFRRAEYAGSDQLAGGENLLFRLDPLAGLAAMLAERQWIAMFWPAVVLFALTLVFGRFFCGWVCPVGTLLDAFRSGPLACWEWVSGRVKRGKNALTPCPSPEGRGEALNAKYIVLLTVLVAAFLQFPLVGLVDPFSILIRGLTFWVDPMFFRGTDVALAWWGDGWVADNLDPIVRKYLLPFSAMTFHLAWTSAALLAALFVLERMAPRFWCRFICPLGAMLGLVARGALFRRLPAKTCPKCDICRTLCAPGAIDPAGNIHPEDCTLCMNCVDGCPKGRVKISVKVTKGVKGVKGVSRRAAFSGLALGVGLPAVAAAARGAGPRTPPADLLRPPGAADESRFLNLCIRCGMCMKVCPTNVLQPALLEAGLEGVFSPRLAPRFLFEQSYCEYHCTLCGQVCPSGAIPLLTEEQKHARPTGKAYFDHARCLPWAEGTPCIRCEEMCPTPDKAIKILRTIVAQDADGQDVEIHHPYVDRDLCVGCGICESNCPLPGVSGIRVQRVDAPDPETEFLLNLK